ncbi:aminomethyl-transferring glycine dehydrogenase subunit GcvPA [Yeguia hominis]|uniref:Probable glycine dehydrogenase (decarboxylating) subunit 1 n=1 Tax=Yeguia hominis TaxID=2763662 RepID=A0A926D8D9_9FIRM|nr:aminomethyl-transferring glycine dehydrogenase subunit GcvPA [Yeguia hominis]MBC8532724.1 aminomethyl-transferring glycine dehydrogenase subunit GcvPA [Yeguia hominis]
MGRYVISTPEEQQEMLGTLGFSSMRELYHDVPGALMLDALQLPKGKSELETRRAMEALAAENRVFPHIFRGAGAYCHYIPAVVRQIPAKEEFLTAYTPYQAEISQGVLQSIFEYQTMICELTGMDVSNASVYDGSTAAAEAVAMCRTKKRTRVLLSAACHPDLIETVRTYCFASDTPLALIPELDGRTDLNALEEALGDDVSCVLLQQPNYYGQIELAEAVTQKTHASGALMILSCNPTALPLLKTPGEAGADIAVGEGQPLGLPLSFGGPYLGFMAAKSSLMRKLPGRIVGETVDADGNRAFVLTLQAREQHIKREKASSSICSNEALCALTASVYLSAMGPAGMRQTAIQCYSKAHYAASAITALPGFSRKHSGDFFHEFVTACPVPAEALLKQLENHGILGGLPLADGSLLWCVTEMNTKEEIDLLVSILKEVSC